MSSTTTSGHLPGSVPAPGLAAGVVAAVFACTSLISFLQVLLLPNVSAGAVLLSAACIAMLLLTQIRWYSRDSGRLRSPLGYTVLGMQTCLAYLPVLVFGQAWLGMPGFLAGSVMLVLRPAVAWPVFALVVASVAVVQWAFTTRPADVLFAAIATVTTGLVVYGLSRLTELVAEVRESRAEMARVAVLRERLRFARDLHDLLGYSLSAITLKIELTHRLMEKSPQEASNQLLEVLEISRLALSDARTVATGYREMSLAEECRSVVSVLSAAEVAVRLEGDTAADLPVRVNTVLATVLREGVTNLLRHSKAKHCEIIFRQYCERASIEVVNDAANNAVDNTAAGRGLCNLSVRAKEIGGKVTVTREGNVFRLKAEVPLHPAPRSGQAERRRSQPAGVPGDADGIDSVTRSEFSDDSGQIVSDGAD